MGRKRSKGGSKSDAPGASINKIERYEDTLEEGGVDDFMFKRDQITFNPQNESDDDDINREVGEEVLGLPTRGSRADEDDEDDYGYEDEVEDAPKLKQRKQKVKPDLTTKGRFGKDEVDSDEEMEGDDDDDDESGSGSDEEEERWGRQYYSRPSTRREKEKDDVYDEKREEERELEEKEVRRLQHKARQTISGADWGLDDLEVEYATPAKKDVEEMGQAPVVVPVPKGADSATLVRHLQAHEPLKLALARDFPLVLHRLRKTAKGIQKMEGEGVGEESLHKGLGWLHYQALLTYATTLAFYLHLCALPVDERPDMSTHPILQRLLQLKEGVTALEDLDFAAGSVSDQGPDLFMRPDGFGDDDDDDEDLEALLQAKRELMARMNEASGKGLPDEDDDELDSDIDIDEEEDAQNLWHQAGLDESELDDLLADAEAGPSSKPEKKPKRERSKKKKSKVPVDEDEEAKEPAVTFMPMEEETFVPSSKKSRKAAKAVPRVADEDEALGDALTLADADATDKEHRKRSLQFHTAKIASSSARRSAARNKRLGGDDDIPYRDRQAARDAALRKNGPKGGEGEDLDGSEWTESDRKRAREVRDEAGDNADEGDDGYYELVKRRKTERDEAKAEAHEEFRAAKFASFEDEETTDGPRGLTRAIEKNRGLTPRRNKAGRNPRVKKRMAFETAKRKVGSQRAVYKGGQSSLSGSYSGETTGISTVIKSRKF